MELLRIERVGKRFGDFVAVNGVSLTLPAQRLTAIIGPNGAGKTTLINLATGALVAITVDRQHGWWVAYLGMPTLQTEYITMLEAFARLFSKRIWEHAKRLVVGAILCPAERTVTAVLRVMGLSGEKHFQNYHRVLNRAVWSSRAASHILLGLLIKAFAVCGPVIMGLDDTIERRRGSLSLLQPARLGRLTPPHLRCRRVTPLSRRE